MERFLTFLLEWPIGQIEPSLGAYDFAGFVML